MVKKIVIIWLVGMVVGLYTTFVLQSLWNWFATEAFHVSQISFWVMYGVVLVVGLLTEGQSNKFEEEQQIVKLAP